MRSDYPQRTVRYFSVNSLLAEILAEKREEVRRLKKNKRSLDSHNKPLPLRDFKRAISRPERIGLIAEIKFASPSAGIIRHTTDPIAVGRIYEAAGASAISLLTDKRYFKGDLNHLPRLKKAISLPILRKDFIIDEIQVKESFLWGADAVLLIARILSGKQFKRLLEACQEMGLAALAEVHDTSDLKKVIECGADIIGINNRNLDTFEVDLGTTVELAPLIPPRHILVSESGIRSGNDIRLLTASGIRAVLVGSALMKSDNLIDKTKELVRAGWLKNGTG
jgi:indole-3-glycerol phosphate synthase